MKSLAARPVVSQTSIRLRAPYDRRTGVGLAFFRDRLPGSRKVELSGPRLLGLARFHSDRVSVLSMPVTKRPRTYQFDRVRLLVGKAE